jgi:Anti-sigma-K factor rskA, C-terminal
MLTEQQIELAHPEAFDFTFGNLPTAEGVTFIRHLTGCRHCRAVVDEYSEIGEIIKQLPPHVAPPAGLEDRTVTAMTAAMAGHKDEPGGHPDAADHDAEDRAVTRIYPKPERKHPAGHETQVLPAPGPGPRQEPEPRPEVTHLPEWRRHRGRLVAAVAAAAAIVAAAIVIPLSLTGGRTTPAQATVVIPLHVTAAGTASGYGAATGQATARQDASGSWDVTLTVHHLKHFDPEPWYGCWYVSRDGQVAPAGTFLVPDSGSRTFSMTSAADPRDFSTMEITIQSPNKNGARAGTVILSGRTL